MPSPQPMINQLQQSNVTTLLVLVHRVLCCTVVLTLQNFLPDESFRSAATLCLRPLVAKPTFHLAVRQLQSWARPHCHPVSAIYGQAQLVRSDRTKNCSHCVSRQPLAKLEGHLLLVCDPLPLLHIYQVVRSSRKPRYQPKAEAASPDIHPHQRRLQDLEYFAPQHNLSRLSAVTS
jgi:hypothetical protein